MVRGLEEKDKVVEKVGVEKKESKEEIYPSEKHSSLLTGKFVPGIGIISSLKGIAMLSVPSFSPKNGHLGHVAEWKQAFVACYTGSVALCGKA